MRLTGLEVGFIDSRISDHYHHTPPPTPHTLNSSLHFYQLHWCFSIFLLFPSLDPGLLSLICRPLGPDCPLWWGCLVHHGTWSSLPHDCAQDPSSSTTPSHDANVPRWSFSRQVMSDSSQAPGLQHARPPCPSLFLRVCPSPCPLN